MKSRVSNIADAIPVIQNNNAALLQTISHTSKMQDIDNKLGIADKAKCDNESTCIAKWLLALRARNIIIFLVEWAHLYSTHPTSSPILVRPLNYRDKEIIGRRV